MKPLFVITFLALIIGCGSPRSQPPAVDPVNPHLHKISYPKGDLEIKNIQLRTDKESRLLHVNIDFFNRRRVDTRYRFRFFWLDADGFPLSAADQGWRRVNLSSGVFPFAKVAQNAKAVDFKLTVERER